MAEFVIMGSGQDYCEVMCGDIIGMDNVTFINNMNGFGSTVEKQHYSRVKKVIKNAFPFLVRIKRAIINSILWSFLFKKNKYSHHNFAPNRKDVRFIFFDNSPYARDELFLKHVRNKYQAKLILYIVNPVSSILWNPRLCGSSYDLIFTVFSHDANVYGWKPYNHLYARISAEEPAYEDEYDTDVFFVGRSKNRLHNILRMYEFLVNHDINCDFHIFDVDEKEMFYKDDIHYNQWLSYKEVVRRVRRSKCVLEIVHKSGEGPTLRMIEAIVYNKKIITNDACASANAFYDKRFIHIFENPENIETDFIKDSTKPDYHYQEEFSAKHFLKCIDKHIDDIIIDSNKLPRRKQRGI